MNKTAQERTLWNKFVENIGDVPGIAAESYFSPDLKKIMEVIRSEDDAIRSTVSGKFIGYASPKGEAISLKDLLKSSKSNFNRREYFKSISDLTKFYEKLKFINDNITSINMDVGKINSKFLFDNLDISYVNQILRLKDTFEAPKAARVKNNFVKIAGILDTLHNLFSERGRSLRYWEKYFPGQLSSLKDGLRGLISNSESLLRSVLGSLKEMAKARSVRNVDSYIKNVNDISSNFKIFEQEFKNFYNKEVKPFLEKEEIFKRDIPAATTEQPVAEEAVSPAAAPAPAAAPPPPAPSAEYYTDEEDNDEESEAPPSIKAISPIDLPGKPDNDIIDDEPEIPQANLTKILTIEELKSIKHSIFESNTDISKQIKSLDDKIKSLENEINTEVNKQISPLKKEMKKYDPKSKEYEEIVNKIQSIRSESQISSIEPLLAEKAKLESKLASNIKKIKQFNHIISIESRIQEIQMSLSQLEEENKQLPEQLSTASEEKKINLQKQIEKNNESINSLKSELEQKELDKIKITNSPEYLELISEAKQYNQLVKNSILNLLVSLSNESPIIVKSVLTTYANCINQKNPQIASKLFKIAKSIKG